MNMLEFIMRATANVPTKSEFGRLMHDDETSEEEKQRILKSVEEAGGYDNLDE